MSQLGQRFRLRVGAGLFAEADGTLALRYGRFEATLQWPGAGRRALLVALADRWVEDAEVGPLVAGLDGEEGILPARLLLRGLLTCSWLERRRYAGEQPMVDVRPRGLGSLPPVVPGSPATRSRLSKLALIRGDGGALVAHSPLSTVEVAVVDGRVAAALVLLAGGPHDPWTLSAGTGLPPDATGCLLDELRSAEVVVDDAGDPTPAAFWSAEELAVHERSRAGRHVLPLGGTYRFRDRLDPQPLRHDFPGVPVVRLPEPDSPADPPLSRVLAARCSVRAHNDRRPITVEQLGGFLHRVGRTSGVRQQGGQDVGRRPYPTGGQICELELYPLVHRCAGVDPGLYHYDSVGHRLELLADHDGRADRMLRYVRGAAGMAEPPQVLLVCTARMARLAWKYEGLAYPMALKDAGVLIGHMYLVATAMSLAPCAVGTGDSATFAAMSGLDPLAEPVVADFLLGSRPA